MQTSDFEGLVRTHRNRIFCTALKITRNQEDAEDVVQISLYKAYAHLGAFEERAKFSTWLTRIAINESLMFLRRRKRTHEALPDDTNDDMESIPAAFVDQKPSPEEVYQERERNKRLADAIKCLSPKLRWAILLNHVHGYSLKEIASITGTRSVNGVKSRLFQGRRKLYQLVRG